MTATRPMVPADLRREVVAESFDLAPDGSFAVVAMRSIARGRYVRRLRRVSLDGSRPRTQLLTTGDVLDRSVTISPDGALVAFVRNDPDRSEVPGRLCVVASTGGRVRTLAPFGRASHAIGEVAWAPDGRSLAFTAEVGPPRWVVGRQRGGRAPTARRITRTDWRWDGEGHLDHWTQLFVVELTPGARSRRLTHGEWNVGDIEWHPDGESIAFVADLGPEPDRHPCAGIWSVPVAPDSRATPRALLTPGGGARRPAFSPDGHWIAAVGSTSAPRRDDRCDSLLLGRADGSDHDAPIDLAPALDRPIDNATDTDLHGWMEKLPTGPRWLDEGTIVALVTDRGRCAPRRWTIDPVKGIGLDEPSPDGQQEELAASALAVAPGAGPNTPGVAVLAASGATTVRLMSTLHDVEATRWNDSSQVRAVRLSTWLDRFDPPTMQRVQVNGPGGPVDTWIASPPDAGDQALPTIVDVHGGPLGSWAATPMLEVFLLTGAGYRVVLPNIRGSAGYGRDWITPQLGDWGGVDAADVHAALDHVIDAGLADPARLGALGLSYGGFMVNWLVGTSDRFAAAVSENGVTNQISAWANSDDGPDYCRTSSLGDPFTPDGVERLWRQSPLRHVANVHTPLLLLQAEADLRCPPQDNEQFFVALRQLGRTVEYVLYPEESHVFASIGRPDRRIDRMERMLAWFGQHLGGDR